MFNKLLLFFAILSFSSLINGSTIWAVDTTPTPTPPSITVTPTIDVSAIQQQIDEYSKKLTELGKSKDTLANQLKQIEYQANLTQLKITQTEKDIIIVELEIANLTININNLDINLNQLSSIFIYQIVQNYKLEKRIPKFVLFAKNNFNDFLNQYKYAATVQKDSQNTLMKMETTRTTFDMQKTVKEKKQVELEDLKKKLAAQKDSLTQQKVSKNKLLEETKNNELIYQQKLADAQAQLASFGNFTSSSGGATLLSNQTHCDEWGCYYSQRDSKWGDLTFGYYTRNGTNYYYDMKGYGCLITSTTMILKHLTKKSIEPSDLAKNTSLFYSHSGNMLQGDLSTNGINFNRTNIGCNNVSLADSELNSGRPVIAGVNGTCGSPAHFIVIKSKKDGKYIINDPYAENGYDIPLPSKYRVVRIETIKLR